MHLIHRFTGGPANVRPSSPGSRSDAGVYRSMQQMQFVEESKK
jgi:hypothetical protein